MNKIFSVIFILIFFLTGCITLNDKNLGKNPDLSHKKTIRSNEQIALNNKNLEASPGLSHKQVPRNNEQAIIKGTVLF